MLVNVVVPMAGEGSRFRKVGFHKPKPMIDVAGKPMIKWVMDNVQSSEVDIHWILVVRKGHTLPNLNDGKTKLSFVECEGLTEGAACTTLLAKHLIDNNTPLLIVNSDQFVEWNTSASDFWKLVLQESKQGMDGNILCFHKDMSENDIKWSYALTDGNGNLTDLQEKKVISENATVGIYYWTRGSDYVMCAEQMIVKNIRVNKEFYVAPVYNEGVEKGMKFKLSFCKRMYGLGVPADLSAFLHEYVQPRSVRLIAHRGNVNGPNPDRENHPSYIEEALAQGFDVEIDVWLVDEKWSLGHDHPQYELPSLDLLRRSGVWVHCKNMAALEALVTDPSIHCFFHDRDDYTLTSRNVLWTYPNRALPQRNSVAVMFDRPEELLPQRPLGICADNVLPLRKSLAEKITCIKLIIFDLDGVLVDSKDMHYHTLNEAIRSTVGPKYEITLHEHHHIYDGLSTRQKLQLMSRYKNLPPSTHDAIFQAKQERTMASIQQLPPAHRIRGELAQLKHAGFPIAVASNCIKASVKAFLEQLDLLDVVDAYYGNEDVAHPKPAPDLYQHVAKCFGVQPWECLVVEDSVKGFEAAIRAGVHLYKVKQSSDVHFQPLLDVTQQGFDPEVTIVIPLARPPQTFWLDGPDQLPSEVPFGLMDLNGKPVWQWVLNSLRSEPSLRRRWIFLVPESQRIKYALDSLLARLVDYEPMKVIPVKHDQLGAVKTVLLAESELQNDRPLVIADGGHILGWVGLADALQRAKDGAVTVFSSKDPLNSYVQVENALLTKIQEKECISETACTGLYLWKRASDFLEDAKQVLEQKRLIHGQYYLSTVVDWGIRSRRQFVAVPVAACWSVRNAEEIRVVGEELVPLWRHLSLMEVYEEMKTRNLEIVNRFGIQGDPQLLQNDSRLCHAVYTMASQENWRPTETFATLKQRLRELLPNHLHYDVGQGLHWTFLQLIGFDVFDSVQLPDDYYSVIEAFLVNRCKPFLCRMDQLVLTPKSLMMCGSDSFGVDHVRESLRRELKRLGYPLFEPYHNNIVHMTLVRFTEPVDEKTCQVLQELVHETSGVLGVLGVKEMQMGPATWQMRDVKVECCAQFSR